MQIQIASKVNLEVYGTKMMKHACKERKGFLFFCTENSISIMRIRKYYFCFEEKTTHMVYYLLKYHFCSLYFKQCNHFVKSAYMLNN